MNPRRQLRWQSVSLVANAALLVVIITADFYGWISGWVSFVGLAICVGWLYVNHVLPRSWYGWLKRLATAMGWDGLLETELLQDAASARMAGRWDQAAPSLEGAAVAAARRGDAMKAVNCLTDAATGYVFIDEFDKARRCRDAAADLASVLGDEVAKRNIRWINGLIAWYSGDRGEAHQLLEDFAAHEAGADPLRAGVAVLALAQMDSDEGHHEKGLARLTSLRGDGLASPRMSTLGLILLRSGRFKSARLALEQGRSTRPLAHRSANTLAEESLTFALLDLAEGNPEPAHQALLATADRHSHDIRMLQGDLLTALGGLEERKGASARARELLSAALKAYEGISPANAASLRHHLDPSSPTPPSTDSGADPLALYYDWPPPAVDEGTGALPSSPLAPLLDRRSSRRISPNTVASLGTAAVTLVFFLPLGWPAAVGLLGLLAIHEFGHYFGARLVGVKARTPIFLGLLGAATIIDRKPGEDVRRDAIITLGGPAAGLAVAALCLVASLVTPSPWHTIFVALARGGFLLNLLQLLPILPLDGGHVARSLHRYWLIVGVVLQVAIVVLLLRSATESVTALAFLAVTIGATVWMLIRKQPQRPAGRGRGLVAAAYLATVAIGVGGLVAGFVVPFRAPAQVVGSRIVGDGFVATVPAGWFAEPVCCDQVLVLVHDDPSGARAGINVLDLRGSGFGFALLAGSPMGIAQAELAADIRAADATTVRDVTPLRLPGLDGVEFTYSCSCHGGYAGELYTSDVVILEHGDHMLSITLGTYTQEYEANHASLDDLLGGWSWNTTS